MLATPDTMPEARRYGTQEPPPGVAAGRPLGAQLAMLRGEGPNLPTPTATVNSGVGFKHRAGGDSLTVVVIEGGLLPTPAVNDMGAGKTPDQFDEWNNGPTMAHQKHSSPLSIEVQRLLPTPKASNNENRPSEGYQAGVGYAIQHTDWGQYAPAIAQWEAILGRPAPSPTVLIDGKPRLNPELTEFMMGMPAGWVTAPEIWAGYLDGRGKPASLKSIHDAQLKACGNGVVSQQAAFALRVMVIEEAAAA